MLEQLILEEAEARKAREESAALGLDELPPEAGDELPVEAGAADLPPAVDETQTEESVVDSAPETAEVVEAAPEPVLEETVEDETAAEPVEATGSEDGADLEEAGPEDIQELAPADVAPLELPPEA